jgi:cation diffusion facilitator family transporter
MTDDSSEPVRSISGAYADGRAHPGDDDHHHDHDHDDDHEHDHDDHGHRSSWWSRLWHQLKPHSHDSTEAIQTAEEASGEGIRAAWISLGGMGATAVLQVAIVAISGSMALLADTIHNFGHLVTTIPLIIAFRLGRRAPTARYPFGYRRAEDLVGLLIALVIALSAALIIWESVNALFDPQPLANLGWVLAAGLVGAAGNELVAIYRIRTGRRIGSTALIAEGNHARADGLTSLAVVLAVIGVWLGFPQADAIVGLLISAVILWILYESTRSVIHRLMDGVDADTLIHIETVAAGVPGVQHVEQVKARWSGHRLEAQLSLGVDPAMSVADSHEVAEQAHHELLHSIPHLNDVNVHVHPSLEGSTPDDAHELSGHHASLEARRRYLESQASGPPGQQPSTATDRSHAH